MLDARGNVLGRFEYVPDAATFEGAITGALGP
jgi:hypothetical protein